MNYIVTVNGEKYEVEVERVGGSSSSLSRRPMERTSRPREAVPASQPAPVAQATAPTPAPVSAVAGSVVSPMPGTILEVKVKEGDAVSVGQVVVILEAMKMENPIVAPKDGIIQSINVAKGDTVETGNALVTIE